MIECTIGPVYYLRDLGFFSTIEIYLEICQLLVMPRLPSLWESDCKSITDKQS